MLGTVAPIERQVAATGGEVWQRIGTRITGSRSPLHPLAFTAAKIRLPDIKRRPGSSPVFFARDRRLKSLFDRLEVGGVLQGRIDVALWGGMQHFTPVCGRCRIGTTKSVAQNAGAKVGSAIQVGALQFGFRHASVAVEST